MKFNQATYECKGFKTLVFPTPSTGMALGLLFRLVLEGRTGYGGELVIRRAGSTVRETFTEPRGCERTRYKAMAKEFID